MRRAIILVSSICLVVSGSEAQTLPLVRPATQAPTPAPPCDASTEKCATLYLDGAVRTADKTSETAAATGSIGVNLAHGRWELITQINLAAATDTIRKSPGQSMLVPGSGGFTNGLIEGRGRIRNSSLLGRVYYSLSSYTWEYPTSGMDAPAAVPVNILGSGASIIWRVADGNIGGLANSRLHVELTAGVMNRTLRGDATEPELDTRRTAFLTTDKLQFNGLEWGMTLGYNDLRGSINYYAFPRASGIRGFTHGQAVAGFAIGAPIVQGPLK